MKFTIYNTATGDILRWGSSNIEQSLAEGEGVIEGVAASSSAYRVDITQEPPVIVEKAAPPPPTLVDLKARLLARLAERRWQAETGGITLNGMTVATDDRSKLLLFAAAERARMDANFTTNWKTENGWVPLDSTTILAVHTAVFSHVSACFAREQELAGILDEVTDAEDLGPVISAIEEFALNNT